MDEDVKIVDIERNRACIEIRCTRAPYWEPYVDDMKKIFHIWREFDDADRIATEEGIVMN